MTTIQKAQQKYSDSLRNYNYYKDIYEDHYNGDKVNKQIKDIEMKMNNEYNLMQTLLYIFGKEIR